MIIILAITGNEWKYFHEIFRIGRTLHNGYAGTFWGCWPVSVSNITDEADEQIFKFAYSPDMVQVAIWDIPGRLFQLIEAEWHIYASAI